MNGHLVGVSNPQRVMMHINKLIQATLRLFDSLDESTLQTVLGEAQTRFELIKKPETKEEEFLLIFYIFKQIGLGFSNRIEHLEELVITFDMVKLKREDRSFWRRDQFLANLIVPLLQPLLQIHRDHTGQKPLVIKSLESKHLDEIDLYS